MLSIRTQGKRSLIPYSRIDIIDGFVEYGKNEESKYFHDFDFEEGMLLVMDNKVLGVYKTATRALQVLDEIQKVLHHNQFIEIVMPLENYSKVDLADEYENTYEMPKE